MAYLTNHKLDEATKQFANKGEKPPKPSEQGEAWETLPEINGFGHIGLQSFNLFYRNNLNKEFTNEISKIYEYRDMAAMTEIADVIEDATNESTQTDTNDQIIHFEITDKDLANNENIVRNLEKEFEELFTSKYNLREVLWNMIRTYYIDGRVFYERVIDTQHPKKGVISIKKLPSETMDYMYDSTTGEITTFFQYLKPDSTRPRDLQDAHSREDVVVFNKEQIGFINYGIYGKNMHDIEGYLHKAIVPYNQLKLLETSVVIYRIVRAPERLVFRIDTGNMPRDKALKYVEKIKTKMSKKVSYDPKTGALSSEPEVMSILENYYMAQSADGRGSQIESVGGNSAGFSELDDIYYFARKLYRALKYPSSRVTAGQEKREADIMFGGNSTGEISRDEIKWAKFLERQQNKFCEDFMDLFLLHLEFKGLKKQYGLTKKKFKITLTKPSNYKEQMEQNFLDSRFNNYTMMADRPEFSKYYLMKRFLKWTDEEIKLNAEYMKKDKDLGFQEEQSGGF